MNYYFELFQTSYCATDYTDLQEYSVKIEQYLQLRLHM
jgi:hypothetical protein